MCETLALVLKEEHTLRVFENSALKKIFEHKREKITGKSRRLNNEELKDLYFLQNIARIIKLRRMRWVGYVTHRGRGAYSV